MRVICLFCVCLTLAAPAAVLAGAQKGPESETEYFAVMESEYPEIGPAIATTKLHEDKTEAKLKEAVLAFKERFTATLEKQGRDE